MQAVRRSEFGTSFTLLFSWFLFLLGTSFVKGTVLKFKAPNLTEEETHGKFMPSNLLCDACKAIAYQAFNKFESFSNLHKHFNYDPPESEVIELVESACDSKLYESYGVKTVDGINRLNGQGMKDAEKVPGMTSGGGKWPGRLVEMCWRFLDLIGEDGIFKAYRERRESFKKFFEFLCLGESSEGRSSCVGVKMSKKEL